MKAIFNLEKHLENTDLWQATHFPTYWTFHLYYFMAVCRSGYHHQTLTICFSAPYYFLKISLKSVQNVLSYFEKNQINASCHITSLVEVMRETHIAVLFKV